ncbi:hypothetical protein FA09DRAFT_337222 [Tilletiopsis washingtonensis]|uniref:F-box domain-containing protein n=1 Tax=Tilletiopsis washingtonensis TaxID=58919 RepID=A0A316ZDW3_9BASI|nr:hypothetical protein FA09DRAFT_337222 [Tilletiopsis washingtonensis]PWN99721.1 hypothetical protein FA09DRAFT_337222 [Tilletiopsis washingtonensis]
MSYLHASPAALPAELVPLLLAPLAWLPHTLAACARVSRTWRHYATPRLYRHIALRDQTRLRRLVRCLTETPELCKLLQVLEIRVYPFGWPAEALEQLEAELCTILTRATNLRQLAWTRTGSLNDRVLPTLGKMPALRHLELTGDARTWSPALLVSSLPVELEAFSVVLPDRSLIEALEAVVTRCPRLQSLSLLMQHSALLLDEHLQRLAPHLASLTRLHLMGARRVTAEGVLPILKHGKLKQLALEGLNIDPNSLESFVPSLQDLHALSLTVPAARTAPRHDFFRELTAVCARLPLLSELTVYVSSNNTPGDADEDDSDDEAVNVPQPALSLTDEEMLDEEAPGIRRTRSRRGEVRALTAACNGRLKKLRIHRVGVAVPELQAMVRLLSHVESLVVHLSNVDNPELLPEIFAQLPQLRELHLLADTSEGTLLDSACLLRLARACPNLAQLGFRNRVWDVDRVPWTRSGDPIAPPGIDRHTTGVRPADAGLDDAAAAEAADDDDDVSSRLRASAAAAVPVLRPLDMSSARFPEVFLVTLYADGLALHESDEAFGAFQRTLGSWDRRR